MPGSRNRRHIGSTGVAMWRESRHLGGHLGDLPRSQGPPHQLGFKKNKVPLYQVVTAFYFNI